MSSAAQPAGVLAVDVGAGTSDILLTRPGQPLENAVKLVVPSATQVAGARIAAATARGQTVVFRGPVMGGGAVTMAMKAHLAAGHAFVATESAAASFADDLDKVRALGARVVGEGAADEVLRRLPADAAAEVASGDLDAAALTRALRPARRGAGVLRRGRRRAGPRLRPGRLQPRAALPRSGSRRSRSAGSSATCSTTSTPCRRR